MAQFKDIQGNVFEAFKVYGVEERDSNTVNVLVENELINNRYVMTREEFKSVAPAPDDYLVINNDGLASFINPAQLNEMITIPAETPPEPAIIATPIEEVPLPPVVEPAQEEVPPSVETLIPAIEVVEEAPPVPDVTPDVPVEEVLTSSDDSAVEDAPPSDEVTEPTIEE